MGEWIRIKVRVPSAEVEYNWQGNLDMDRTHQGLDRDVGRSWIKGGKDEQRKGFLSFLSATSTELRQSSLQGPAGC
jgi:hypothetical protein